MKKIIKFVLPVLLVLSFAGCGSKYCSVTGCPKESASGADYCYEHKCSNFSCTNRAAGSYSYCRKCLERSIKK